MKFDPVRVAIWAFSAWMAWLVARSALHLGPFYYLLYNADFLYIPGFFDDLLHHGGTVSGWRFSPAPSFFPDMAIYGAASLAGAGFRTTVILCAALQTALFLEGVRALGIAAGLRNRGVFAGAVMVLIVLCFCQFFVSRDAFPKTNDVFWLTALVQLGNHFGAILASVWGLALLTGALRGELPGAVVRIAGLGVLILVTGGSDLLYLIWFCAPALFVLLCGLIFARPWRRRIAAIAGMISVTGGLVYALQRAYNPLLGLYYTGTAAGWGRATASFGFLFHFLFASGTENAAHAAIIVIPMAALMVFAAVRLIRRDPDRAVRTLCVGFMAASPACCLAAGAAAGLFQNDALPRYTLPVLYMPILGIAFVGAEALDRRDFRLPAWGRPALAGILPLFCLFLATRSFSARLPEPADLACLPKDRPLAGLAEYWGARPLTLFSDRRLQVEPLSWLEAKPFWWIGNRTWFERDFAEPDKAPLYSFIVMRRLDPAMVEARYGAPDHVQPCGDSEIWLYDRPEELSRRFRSAYATDLVPP